MNSHGMGLNSNTRDHRVSLACCASLRPCELAHVRLFLTANEARVHHLPPSSGASTGPPTPIGGWVVWLAYARASLRSPIYGDLPWLTSSRRARVDYFTTYGATTQRTTHRLPSK